MNEVNRHSNLSYENIKESTYALHINEMNEILSVSVSLKNFLKCFFFHIIVCVI